MDLWMQRIRDDGTTDGEPERVTAGMEMRSAVFSPNGTKLAFSRGRRLVANAWRIPLPPDRIATWADAEQLTFDQAFIEYIDVSPDGETLAVSSDRNGAQDLWLLPAAGGEMRQLTTEPTPDWRPSFSPDGSEMAFYSYRGGNRDLWVMPISGGPARQLAPHEAAEYHPDWSPDGNWISFASTRDGAMVVWIVSAEGGEPRKVGAGNTSDWSPDSKRLALRGRGGIELVDAEGGEPEQISEGGANPRWSPDGREVYFGRQPRAFYAFSVETSDERQLADLSGKRGFLGAFGLATDGRYLYFSWQEDVGDIWVMDVVMD